VEGLALWNPATYQYGKVLNPAFQRNDRWEDY